MKQRDKSGTYVNSFMSVKLTDMWSITAGMPSDVTALSSPSTILKQLLTVSRPRSITRTCRDIELRGTKMTGALILISNDMRNALVDKFSSETTAPSAAAAAALASRRFFVAAWNWFKKLYNTHTAVLRLCGICPGQPGWAGTRINIHPLTPIVVINRPLSASSIYYDPWHPPCSIHAPDNLTLQVFFGLPLGLQIQVKLQHLSHLTARHTSAEVWLV